MAKEGACTRLSRDSLLVSLSPCLLVRFEGGEEAQGEFGDEGEGDTLTQEAAEKAPASPAPSVASERAERPSPRRTLYVRDMPPARGGEAL